MSVRVLETLTRLVLAFHEVAWTVLKQLFTWSPIDPTKKLTPNLKSLNRTRSPELEELEATLARQGYGYRGRINKIRELEFKRLQGVVYLDHAGATLFSEVQARAAFEELSSTATGNPHSQHEHLLGGVGPVARARDLVLGLCNAPPGEYSCVLTSGATAGLRLVAEAFPWAPGSRFCYTLDNHNSVVGIREAAAGRGAEAAAVDVEDSGGGALRVAARGPPIARRRGDRGAGDGGPEPLRVPVESNFSGEVYDIRIVDQVRQGRGMPGPGEWFSLVDAAKACGVKPPDLSRHRADFVVLSFYKIFGYPTGLGAILIHRRAEEILERRYFGGGTVEAVAAEEDFVRRRSGAAGFEDGTPNFLALPALAHGLERIERLGGFPALEAHTHALASHLASWLRAARHGDGAAVAVVYGWGAPPAGRRAASWVRGQGPVVAFNLLRRGGGWVGAREVERLAALRGIRLRTGCFCNPGACQLHLGLSAQDVRRNHAKGHVCWDDNDLVDGRPLGAVRASLGWMSTLDDVLALQRFIEDSFISSEVEDGNSAIVLASPHGLSNSALGTELPRVEEIYVYPVKSLAGFRVGAWPVSSTGLLYDRHWAVLREDGAVLTQKRVAEMALIKPSLDLKRGILTLTSQNMETALHVRISEVPSTGPPSLESDANFSGTNGSSQKCFQCGNNRTVETTFDVSDLGVAAWLTRALGTRCRLAVDTDSGSRKGKDGSRISYANEAQFLFVNKASVDDLNRRVSGRAASAGEPFAPQIRPGRFRPNIVVGGLRPYEEDEWNKIRIGGVLFVSAGPCQRCQMLCIDPSSGLRQGNEPLATLATYRRREGKIVFGRLMTFHGLGGVQGSSRRSEASADAEPEDTSAWPRELVDTGAILRSGSVVEYEPDN
eukprot:CAMPEP_0177601416 /NCGR_PEP_ID=MMETSP0419_2-20121207/14247_1 /TAXON_ID=582737 /ORGANISM="Tetraselmis sp., Strain GSL018" /LENGTH=890 /DNA_ID=CAMNT_0019094679 /DNA_START=231 /DNA_END=2904 /DNA_ORIENTATION=-